MTAGHKDRLLKPNLAPLLAVLANQAVLFLAIKAGPTTTDFATVYSRTSAGGAFYLAVVLYAGWVCAEIAVASVRFLGRMTGAFLTRDKP